MAYQTDRDGKSKTASAVAEHQYPEQNEVIQDEVHFGSPSQSEIAERAYKIWQERGCPEGTCEVDWLEAEQQLGALNDSRKALNSTPKTGSVQR